MNHNFIESILKQFKYYQLLGIKTFDQLDERELTQSIGADSNSISILVKHMHGNMLSRFTDFLTSDGEKEWRKRDAEFEGTLKTREEIVEAWNDGWDCVFNAMETVTDLEQIVYIRNQGHTVYEALNRQLAHYAYHVGQIVFLGTFFKGDEWQSLSIPKNKSVDYNTKKFEKQKKQGHFTDEFLKK